MIFSDHQRRFLKELGRTEVGRNFVEVLKTSKEHYSSINTIDPNRDANAQIEGRKIFADAIDEISNAITVQKHQPKPQRQESYE